MLEAELKAALSGEQAAALPKTLAALGFREQSAVQESDVYFNGPDRDFRETDEALRLRTVKLTSGAGADLDYLQRSEAGQRVQHAPGTGNSGWKL